MDEVKVLVRVGRVTPPRQRVTILGADLSPEDEGALIRAATGSGEVMLNTEHGPWRFLMERSTLGTRNAFHLVSAGPPGR